MLFEKLFFQLGDWIEENVYIRKIEVSISFWQVSIHTRQKVLVHENKGVQGSLSDAEWWEMRQKIISYKKAEEHKVIQDSLEIKFEGKLDIFELKIEIFT